MFMKKSIKWQYTLIFGGVIAGTIICVWLINVLFLGSFYEGQKEKELISAYYSIDRACIEGSITSEEFDVKFNTVASNSNLNMLIMDTDTKTIKTTENDTGSLSRRLLDYVLFGPREKDKVISYTDRYTVQRTMDSKFVIEYIELWGLLSDGKMVLIRTPLESLKESARISNRFLLHAGLFGVILSMIITFLMSRKVTKPILELANISEKMAHLDFEEKYHSEGKNEIDILGEHINDLSSSLEKMISELKTANNELLNDLAKKNKMEEMRKDFLSNVSHELKTPIALIQGYAEGLVDNVNSNPEDREYYCEVIIDEAKRMNKIVKSLLELNEIESGNDGIVMQRFDVVELINNYLHSLDLLIKQNGITIKFNSDTSEYVWSDEFKVEQVVNNYIMNAIHYCKNEKVICVDVKQNSGIVRISVFNSGEPIPDDALEHLWTKFYKVDKARTREYGGSGIGLSIVKAIMDSLNNNYGVINHNNGVEFWFELDGKAQCSCCCGGKSSETC